MAGLITALEEEGFKIAVKKGFQEKTTPCSITRRSASPFWRRLIAFRWHLLPKAASFRESSHRQGLPMSISHPGALAFRFGNRGTLRRRVGTMERRERSKTCCRKL
jgi:hypothetical protein